MSVFSIDMLPAREGDCLWVEYGDPIRPRRILVDGGRQSTYGSLKQRLEALPVEQREFELLILSHIDADHIEGLLKLVCDSSLSIRFKDVWFNGRDHLDRPNDATTHQEAEELGARQGELFSQAIRRRGWEWNAAFDGGTVVIPQDGSLPVRHLADGMKLTLLSPTWQKLEKLRPVWDIELDKAGMGTQALCRDTDPPGLESFGALTVEEVEEAAIRQFKADQSTANGASIAVVAEFDGRRIALTGDAHADVVAGSLERLRVGSADKYKLDAFKLSHHGSRGTHSTEIMRRIECRRFLISSDGSRHKHPHIESVARTLCNAGGGIDLICNYRSDQTSVWDVSALKQRFGYEVVLPAASDQGFARLLL